MKKALIILLILSGVGSAIAGIYWTGYKVGQADERAENNAAVALELEKTAQRTRELQEANDTIASQFHETTLNLTEKEHALQNKLESLRRENQRVEDMADHANAAVEYYRIRLDSFVDGLRIVSSAGICPGLPDSDHPPRVIETPDELLSYTVSLASDRCEIAVQLDSLISISK